MNRDKILQDLGLAYKAGKLVSGEEFSLEKIKSGRTKLVFLASDAGINTTKRITDKSTFYGVELVRLYTSEELSHAIGKANRKVLALTDARFTKLIQGALRE